ncbi:cytochrome C oxidase subunit IV family protein [Aeromicrobium alkaliterrae]|uniref:Prokaryotic cytochrome C oxidase subunit IV family protein n=1 Tax=Aeromicrobium alkaliterrae TaxID=302168 RepID=A0ABN2K8I9_9ACTN
MTTSPTRLVTIWAGLVAATVLSWLLGVEHAADDVFSREAVAALLVAITAVKVWYVGLDFMEVRESAPWLRWLFTAWLAATSLTLGTLLVV